MLDNLGGPNVIAKVLKSRRRNQNRDPEREREQLASTLVPVLLYFLYLHTYAYFYLNNYSLKVIVNRIVLSIFPC